MQKVDDISIVYLLAALQIVNYHTRDLAIPLFKHIATFGFVFNAIFVLLSGYLLARSLVNKPLSFAEFLRKRLLRIYPPLHVSLVFIAIIFLAIGKTFTWQDSLLAASGFSYFFSNTVFGVHLWFLAVILSCYFLCLPSMWLIRKNALLFFAACFALYGVAVMQLESGFTDLYNQTNWNSFYRFLYYSQIFLVGLWFGIFRRNAFLQANWMFVLLFAVVLPIYAFAHKSQDLGWLTLLTASLLSLGLIHIFLLFSPMLRKRLPFLLLLTPITFELYLIHYAVINWAGEYFYAQYIAYPLVFIVSFGLAFLIHKGATYYHKQLTIWLEKIINTAKV